MNWIKYKLLYPLLSVGIGFFIVFAVCEIVLRFLPVSDYLYPQTVNDESPVLKLLPNRMITYSAGWDFKYKNTVRINNDGFVNEQDYTQNDTLPLLSIIGDSYIEALMVPYKDTVHGVLAEKLHNKKIKVYSFGFSGAPLSQYLSWASYTKKKFNNQFLVVNIVGNDFSESLRKYNNYRGGYIYSADKNGRLSLERIDYNFTKLRFIWKSSLARYLLLNLQTINIVNPIFNKNNGKFVGNVEAKSSEGKNRDSVKVISAFLRDLPEYSGLPKNRIVLCVDGIRSSVYDSSKLLESQGSYFGIMRKELLAQTEASGFEIIDLQPIFNEYYKIHKMKFEFPTDGHWNERGHAVFAETILASENYKGFIKELYPTNGR